MRVACVGYRDWALNIYDRLARSSEHVFLIVRSRAQFNEELIRDFHPNLVLFYGWSWRVPDELLQRHTCLMLHPSDLPLYRGGSPIQNQIIDGVQKSKVSIFVMTGEMDAGDLVGQEALSLGGSIREIFAAMEDAGVRLTEQLLKNGLKRVPQEHAKATYCRRRAPSESEITREELFDKDARYLFDKIRMLGDPYPNAFIRTRDGKRLLIKAAEIREDECDLPRDFRTIQN